MLKSISVLAMVAVATAAAFTVVHPFLPEPPLASSAAAAESKPDSAAAPAPKKPDMPKYSKSLYDVSPLTEAKIEALAKERKLTDEERAIILSKGTERAFCGTLLDNKKQGVYTCRLCGLPLFSSDAKFDSGTGWPSFFQPFDPAHVTQQRDISHGMVRVEINCARCGGHLGHVFEDGPRPTGLRFCLNSASLEFAEKGKPLPEISRPIQAATAYFGGGCFWGVEDRFQQLPGVIDAESGYMGGKTKDPTYEQVCTHTTGHAEVVKVVFDPARVTYKELLAFFFRIHDPTQLNRQGPDIGDNYRSCIFTESSEQLQQARDFMAELQKTAKFKNRTIVTQLLPTSEAGKYYKAEEYHQDYHAKHGGTCPIPPE